MGPSAIFWYSSICAGPIAPDTELTCNVMPVQYNSPVLDESELCVGRSPGGQAFHGLVRRLEVWHSNQDRWLILNLPIPVLFAMLYDVMVEVDMMSRIATKREQTLLRE